MLSSLDLLPQSPDSWMIDSKIKIQILGFKLLLLDELIDALEFFFIEKDLSKFDPHVGETSCQVRACQMLSLLEEMKGQKSKVYSVQKLAEINAVKSNIQTLIAALQELHLKPVKRRAVAKTQLRAFMEAHQCTFALTQEELFLFHAYILTRFRKVNGLGDMCIDYNKVYAQLNVSRSSAVKFIHCYQVRMAQWSCQYVQERIAQVHDAALSRVLPHLQIQDSDGRAVFPCLHMMEVLLQDLLHMQKSIVIVVERRSKLAHLDKVIIAFEVKNGAYEYCAKIKNKPSFIVYGTMVYQDNEIVETEADYIQRFKNAGIVAALLSNMAAHPQYSGLPHLSPYELVKDPILSEAVLQLKSRQLSLLDVAKKIGCEKNNPELLFIRHINCNRPDFSHFS